LQVKAHTITTVSLGKTTSRYSTSSTVIRGERRDRLVAKRLLDRCARERGLVHQRRPLLGVFRQKPDGVRQLALGCVDAADQHVQHEIDALLLAETIAFPFGGKQRGDQIVGGMAAILAAGCDQRVRVLVELLHGQLDTGTLVHHRGGVELSLDPVRPVVKPRRVGQRRPHHGGDRLGGIGLGKGLHELAAPRIGDPREQPAQELAHRGPPALDRARSQRGIHEGAQARVVGAVDVEDVGLHLLPKRPVFNVEQLGDLHSREDRRARPQEELARFAVEHDVPVRPLREPPLGGELAHRRVKALPP
jgi:hypothetical protein